MACSLDVELRLVDPEKNKFRVYGLTECRTLFGELALKIVWGRLGAKSLRERTETFAALDDLERRRDELLRRRRRHGYVVYSSSSSAPAHAHQVERAIVEAHGLPLASPVARALVARWHAATRELAMFVANVSKEPVDLVDVSTLAAMYARAEGFS